MDKQIKYADKRGIPFVGIIGETEASRQAIVLKDMQTGQQETIRQQDFIPSLKERLATQK